MGLLQEWVAGRLSSFVLANVKFQIPIRNQSTDAGRLLTLLSLEHMGKDQPRDAHLKISSVEMLFYAMRLGC